MGEGEGFKYYSRTRVFSFDDTGVLTVDVHHSPSDMLFGTDWNGNRCGKAGEEWQRAQLFIRNSASNVAAEAPLGTTSPEQGQSASPAAGGAASGGHAEQH